MIIITEKSQCCGCSACQQICPKNCISMQEDNEGFLYPKIDSNLCVNCHLCEKVCPVLNIYEASVYPLSFACINKDKNIVQNSSSGGFFTVLAKYIIEKDGVVFGVRFDDKWSAIFDYTDNEEELYKYRGSKYVQPFIGDNYRKVKSLLSAGRPVLFVGTSCQVSGLNHFLRKKYENLITVDIVCHSIPSPKVWRKYLDCIKKQNEIYSITFRDKSFGWRNYGLKITGKSKDGNLLNIIHEGKDQNLYMRGFLSDLYTRPSCSNCPARNYTSGSDIMIADFWGVEKYHPEIDTNSGISLVLVKTDKGKEVFESIKNNFNTIQVSYDEVEDKGLHRPITSSSNPHYYRSYFYKKIKQKELLELINECLDKGEKRQMWIRKVKKIAEALGVRIILKLIKNKK